MLAAVALASLLCILLLAPMALATHAVVQRASRRWTVAWLAGLLVLMCLSLTLAAIALAFSELTR
jgi:hypothetical protein